MVGIGNDRFRNFNWWSLLLAVWWQWATTAGAPINARFSSHHHNLQQSFTCCLFPVKVSLERTVHKHRLQDLLFYFSNITTFLWPPSKYLFPIIVPLRPSKHTNRQSYLTYDVFVVISVLSKQRFIFIKRKPIVILK